MDKSLSGSSMNHGQQTDGMRFRCVPATALVNTTTCNLHLSQGLLPQRDGKPAVPFCIIFYADKTKLSTMGTKKGYPVYVRCANLPAHIRNGEGLGGGMMVGLLPIVSTYPDFL
jgi:hypothetical protein